MMNSTVTSNSTVNNSVAQSHPYILEPSLSLFFRLFVFVLITLASVLGNAVVCRAMLMLSYRQLPLSYYLVTNLAAAEMISSLCFPFYFAYDWMGEWPFGEAACKLVFPVQMTATLVVTYTLALIAARRYRVIVTYRGQLGPLPKRKAFVVLCLLWSAAMTVVAPSAVVHSVTLYGTKRFCVALFPGDTTSHAPSHTRYSIIRLILTYAVPYLTIVISYSAVALRLKRHMARATASRKSDLTDDGTQLPTDEHVCIPLQRLEIDNKSSQGNGSEGNAKYLIAKIWKGCCWRRGSFDGRSTQGQTSKTAKHPQDAVANVTDQELDILRMIYVIIIIFIICYIPIQVLFIYEQLNGGPSPWPYYLTTRKYVFLLHCLPGAFHPVLYGTMSKFYANAFAKLVMCKK
ncbi:neuropeptide Y receptor type 1-like [Stylophora pistillata]|uniref:neuropeptide Y receptor type 1-like n=1 Tax=Stylophora pistillata TaxID=50429 RepID=UPI000C05670C|nr:neuropeptide Y receptor type 1-like [Stylophora pistillata]